MCVEYVEEVGDVRGATATVGGTVTGLQARRTLSNKENKTETQDFGVTTGTFGQTRTRTGATNIQKTDKVAFSTTDKAFHSMTNKEDEYKRSGNFEQTQQIDVSQIQEGVSTMLGRVHDQLDIISK